MPGKGIDYIFLSILGTVLLYLLYLNAGYGIVLSAALSFITVLLFQYLIEHRPRRYALTRDEALDLLDDILRMDEPEALSAVQRLVDAAYHDSDAELILHLRHPSAQLSADDALLDWKAHKGQANIRIAATCAASPECRAAAIELKEPVIDLIDRNVLLQMVRSTGIYTPSRKRTSQWRRLRVRVSELSCRRVSPKALIYSACMLGIYLLTGRALYLAASMLVLLFSGISWIRSRLYG